MQVRGELDAARAEMGRRAEAELAGPQRAANVQELNAPTARAKAGREAAELKASSHTQYNAVVACNPVSSLRCDVPSPQP